MSTPKNVTHVLQADLDGNPVKVAVTPETPVSVPSKPRRSFQDTEVSTPDAPLHTFSFDYEGYTIFGVELTQAQLNECKRLEASLAALVTEGQGVTDVQRATALGDQMAATQLKLWDFTVGHCVTGWTFPSADGSELPCNDETKAHLPITDKEALYKPLVQKSTFGGDVQRFLAKP